MQSRQVDLSEMQPRLLAWLQGKMPQAQDLAISAVERPGVGMSSETYLFNLSWQEAGQQEREGLVIRYGPQSYPVFPEYDLAKQFRIMQALGSTDVPVPTVYWLEESQEAIGTPFYLMGKIDGVLPAEYPPYHSFGLYFNSTPKQRAKMWWGTLETMAKIHKVDWRTLDLSFLGTAVEATGPLDRHLDYYESYLRWVKEYPQEQQPILEAALDWLRTNRYVPETVTLCWGDPKITNTIYSPDFEVMGVVDWEMAYLGDPESDLAHLMFMDWVLSEGHGIPRLDGSPSREETVRRWEELTGWKARNLFYNDVLVALRYGVIQLRIYKNLKKLGVTIGGGEDIELNNVCTQKLASMLDLPAPGPPLRQATKVEDVRATVQFHLTGPSGGDWYVVADRGEGTRYEGVPWTTLMPLLSLLLRTGQLSRGENWTACTPGLRWQAQDRR